MRANARAMDVYGNRRSRCLWTGRVTVEQTGIVTAVAADVVMA
jgi:hypothetical protein